MYITIFSFIYFLISLWILVGIIKENPQDFSPIGWKDVFEIILNVVIFYLFSPVIALIIILYDRYRRFLK
jgi:ABC-type Fe3+-siderophore transport system permease subunit